MRDPLFAALLLLLTAGCQSGAPVLAVTFNTGTSEGSGAADHPDGYGPAQAEASDLHYGDGLAFTPIVEATRAYLAALRPDVIAFQEIFHPEECADIPEEARVGFVCETWAPGDRTVAQAVLGEGYQIACMLARPDKCLGVRRAFGTIRGCAADLCLDGLDGARIPGCGGGARVGRAVIDRAVGPPVTVVAMHGSSGLLPEDQACRIAQLEQVFLDLDGAPGASGERNLVLGDFNTDPDNLGFLDESARRFRALVDASDLIFHSPAGEGLPRTYANAVNIDHVLSDFLTGECEAPGVTPGTEPVYAAPFFDHVPIVCALTEP